MSNNNSNNTNTNSKRMPLFSLVEVRTSQFNNLRFYKGWGKYDGCHSISNKQQVDNDTRIYLREIRISGLIKTIQSKHLREVLL